MKNEKKGQVKEPLLTLCESTAILTAPNKYIENLLKSFNELNAAITTMEETKTCTLQDLGNLEILRERLRVLFDFKGGGYYRDAVLNNNPNLETEEVAQ